LGDGNHEAEIGANELVERFLLASPDALCEIYLFFAGNQRVNADVAEVLVQGAFLVRGLLLSSCCGHWDSCSVSCPTEADAFPPRSAVLPGGSGVYQRTRLPNRVQRILVSHDNDSAVSGA